MAIKGSIATQFTIAKVKRIHDSAHATQKILYELDANNAAKIPHQIQVRSHWSGEAPDATARDMDRGMFIIATVSPGFQFFLIFGIEIFII